MCLAVYSPKRLLVKKDLLRNGFSANKDGAGFAFLEDGRLIVKKGYFTFDEFWNVFSRTPKDSPVLIHFRKQTHGAKNEENCHPWIIDDNHAMIHNGVIKQHSFSPKACKISDTGIFVEQILKPMFAQNSDAWKEPWAKALLESYIGIGNKMVIMSNTGNFVIFRASFGVWVNNVWYSNDSYRSISVYNRNNFYNRIPDNKGFLKLSSSKIEELDEVLEKTEKARKAGVKNLAGIISKVSTPKPPKISITEYAESLIKT